MQPAQRHVGIVVHDAGALSLRIHEKLGAERKVVELVGRIVDVSRNECASAVQVSVVVLPQCAAFGALDGIDCGLNGIPPTAMIYSPFDE
jgi:hypothetical protein